MKKGDEGPLRLPRVQSIGAEQLTYPCPRPRARMERQWTWIGVSMNRLVDAQRGSLRPIESSPPGPPLSPAALRASQKSCPHNGFQSGWYGVAKVSRGIRLSISTRCAIATPFGKTL